MSDGAPATPRGTAGPVATEGPQDSHNSARKAAPPREQTQVQPHKVLSLIERRLARPKPRRWRPPAEAASRRQNPWVLDMHWCLTTEQTRGERSWVVVSLSRTGRSDQKRRVNTCGWVTFSSSCAAPRARGKPNPEWGCPQRRIDDQPFARQDHCESTLSPTTTRLSEPRLPRSPASRRGLARHRGLA